MFVTFFLLYTKMLLLRRCKFTERDANEISYSHYTCCHLKKNVGGLYPLESKVVADERESVFSSLSLFPHQRFFHYLWAMRANWARKGVEPLHFSWGDDRYSLIITHIDLPSIGLACLLSFSSVHHLCCYALRMKKLSSHGETRIEGYRNCRRRNFCPQVKRLDSSLEPL